MDVRRDFKARPPRWWIRPPHWEDTRPTLADLAEDFAWRFPRSERDPVADYCAEADSLEEAIRRACRSRGADGKMSNHQSRVPERARNELERRLIIRASNGEFDDLPWFTALYNNVDIHGQLIDGIGPVTTYDVTYRIACYLGLPVDALYLHAGVRKGLDALYEALGKELVPRHYRHIGIRDLPKELRKIKDPNDIEDFLCTYREVFPDIRTETS